MSDLGSIYLDNHATTRCDPRVIAAMLPLLTDCFGNVNSTNHAFGREAKEHYEAALASIAADLGCGEEEIVITSGATEANNLALLGFVNHPRQKRRTIVSVQTEHPAVLDPLKLLETNGFNIVHLPVIQQGHDDAGRIDLNQLEEQLTDDTALVSVMHANNEIGVLQDLPAIAALCHQVGAVLHTDATQSVGKVPLTVDDLDVDLLSASAHKLYGPKGVGLLFVRRRGRRVRLLPQILGGGQQRGLRSGTINSPGAVALATALRLCQTELTAEAQSETRALADRCWERIHQEIPEAALNGPAREPHLRLPGNLNICLPEVEADSLLAAIPNLAASSGAACSTMDPSPSHVLLGLGLSESAARRSLRLGIGRFNTTSELDTAALWISQAYHELRQL